MVVPFAVEAPELREESLIWEGQPAGVEEAGLLGLTTALPPLLQAFSWVLVYRLSRDGASLQSLLRHAADAAPSLLLAKVAREGDRDDVYVVGALASRALPSGGKWSGTGQSWVCGCRLSSGPEEAEQMQTHGWSRESSCFQLCGKDEGLAYGGGGEHGYGLWFDPELQRATSAACTTYGNTRSLLSPAAGGADGVSVAGVVLEVELWTFDM